MARAGSVGRARSDEEAGKKAEQTSKTPQDQRLAKKLRRMEDPSALRFLEALEAELERLRLEQLGPDREAKLARLVAETLARRGPRPAGPADGRPARCDWRTQGPALRPEVVEEACGLGGSEVGQEGADDPGDGEAGGRA